MTQPHSDMLLAPETDERPASAPQPAPPPSPTRWFWPLLLVVAAALALLGTWTLTQARTVDEVVDAPRVHSDHDGWIQLQLREQAHVRTTQVDPWIRTRVRDQEGAGQVELDPWIQARLRDQAR